MSLLRIAISLAVLSAVSVVTGEEIKPSAGALLRQLDEGFAEVFQKVAPAVVIIEVRKQPNATDSSERSPLMREQGEEPLPFHLPERLNRSEGSGFIIRADGYVCTNSHVIEDASEINVLLKDGRKFPAKIAGVDDKTDIAVLKVDATDLPAAELGDSQKVRVGQLVCAIGIPYNLDYSFTAGWVSATGRSGLTSTPYEDYIQTDAFINPGNSGGPLFDVEGKVIGMNTLINGIGRGLAFAIPSNMLVDVSQQLIANGRVVRPWLGIGIRTFADSPELRELVKGVERGVFVNTIEAGAPVLNSDLQVTDVILKVDGVAVDTAQDLQRQILAKKIGQPVELTIWRKGKYQTVAVTPGELPQQHRAIVKAKDQEPSKQPVQPSVHGLELGDAKDSNGVLVTGVLPGSLADAADIRRDDVINEVNSKAVNDAATLRKFVDQEDLKKGVVLLIDRRGRTMFTVLRRKQ
jgi:serine protease Do